MSQPMSATYRDRGDKGVTVRTYHKGKSREIYVGKGHEAVERAKQMCLEIRESQCYSDFWEAGEHPLPVNGMLYGWLVDHSGLRSWRTQQSDRDRVRKLVQHFEDLDLRELKERHLRQFATAVIEQGQSGSTAAGCLSILRRVFNLAVQEELLIPRYLPWSKVMRAAEQRTKTGADRKVAWTREEVEILLGIAKERERHLYPALVFAFHTGARRGEFLALKWEAVDFSTRRVRIYEVPTGEGGGKTKAPKTGRERIIPISDELLMVLEAQRRSHVPLPAWVFPSPRGVMWDENNFKSAWRRLMRKAQVRGVRPLKFHTTRATFASWAFASGVPAKRISEWTGASVQTLELHYAHQMPPVSDPMGWISRTPETTPETMGGSMGYSEGKR
jgi:integrase